METSKLNRFFAVALVLVLAATLAFNTRNWYSDNFLKVKTHIETHFSVFPKDDVLKRLFNEYMILTGRKHINDYVIMNDGRPVSDLVIGPRSMLLDDRANVVISLNDYLQKQETHFLFVSLPYKLYNNSELPRGYESTMIEDVSLFLTKLKANGVDVLDIREHMAKDFNSFAPLFFWGDFHWNNDGALYAYGKIGQQLNSRYGFGVDPKTWDLSEYERLTIEKAFSFPSAVQFLAESQGGEDIDILYPRFRCDLTVETFDLTVEGKRDVLASGDYPDVFIPSVISKDSQPLGYRSLNRFGQDRYRYTNTGSQAQQKILLITDSFGWILAPYLSTGVGTVDYLYLNYTNQQTYQILQNNHYDLVIYHISEGWINDSRNNGSSIETDYMYLGKPQQ